MNVRLDNQGRRRWPYVLAAALGAILLAVAMAPTLLSTPAGNGLLLGFLNHRIAGHLGVERIKLGWRSGIAARGVVLDDAEGRRILDAPEVATELSLLRVLRDPKPLGRTSIDVRSLDLVSFEDGTSNFSRTLGLKRVVPAGPAGLPFLGDVRFTIHEVSWSAPGRTTLRGHDGAGEIVVEGTRGRVSADVAMILDAAEIGATPLRAHLVGELDSQSRMLSVTEPSVLEEGKEADNRLEVAAGSRLSWGEQDSNVHLLARYDLHRLTVLLAPVLPGGLELTGRHSAEMQVSGKLADGQGLQRLRTIQVAPTSFAYDRISSHGLTLENGRVPIRLEGGVLSFDDGELPLSHGGAVSLAGRVDLNGAVPRYVLDTPRVVVRDIDLNEQLATGPLSFLPFAWGRPSSVQGRATVRLDHASLPLSGTGMKRDGTLAGHMFITNLDVDAPAVGSITGAVAKAAASRRVHEARVDVPFMLSEGRVHFENVSASTGPFDLSFSGSVGIDGTIDAQSKVKAAHLPMPASVVVKGTVEKPDVQVVSGFGSPIQKLPGLLDKLHPPGH